MRAIHSRSVEAPWGDLEDFTRDLLADSNEVYLVAGGYGSGGSGSLGGLTTSIAGSCVVPARYWKVLVILPWGGNDLARINTSTRVIAVDMPNTQTANTLDWYQYRTSVEAIEASTGLNGCSCNPTAVKNELEGGA